MKRRDGTYNARVYYTEEKSETYQTRNPRRHRAEMALIERTLGNIPRGSVLDIPCGGGRVGLFLSKQGHAVTCADYSQPMVDITRRNVAEAKASIEVDRQDIEKMTYADGSFNTVVCFRLFHHFPDQATRARAVGEMCRVASDRVALSYFSPFAFSTIDRRLRSWISGRPLAKFATSLAEVRSYFEAAGFQLEHDFGQLPLFHTLHVAVFRRTRAGE